MTHGEALRTATGASNNSQVVQNEAGHAVDTETEHALTLAEHDGMESTDTNYHPKPSSPGHVESAVTKSISHRAHPASLTPVHLAHTALLGGVSPALVLLEAWGVSCVCKRV